jgi:hypothetical protein
MFFTVHAMQGARQSNPRFFKLLFCFRWIEKLRMWYEYESCIWKGRCLRLLGSQSVISEARIIEGLLITSKCTNTKLDEINCSHLYTQLKLSDFIPIQDIVFPAFKILISKLVTPGKEIRSNRTNNSYRLYIWRCLPTWHWV